MLWPNRPCCAQVDISARVSFCMSWDVLSSDGNAWPGSRAFLLRVAITVSTVRIYIGWADATLALV